MTDHSRTVLTELDAEALASWSSSCADALSRRKNEINQLNVFPVPDADTGSNMAYTMAAAVENLHAIASDTDLTTAEVASALATGAVRGARGNSGVVLSQLLRGLADAAGRGILGPDAIRVSLRQGYEFVQAAIADPVEGTVITVLRSTAAAVDELFDGDLASEDPDLQTVVHTALGAAQRALERTPSQLPALREAGVVDAGGAGLVILLGELAKLVAPEDGLEGTEIRGFGTGSAVQKALSEPMESHVRNNTGELPELEVMCFIEGADLELVTELLENSGDSVVVGVLDEEAGSGRVHVHTKDAGGVIEGLMELGDISDIRIEALVESVPAMKPGVRQRSVIAAVDSVEVGEFFGRAGAETVIVEHPGQTSDKVISKIRELGISEAVILTNGLINRETARRIAESCTEFCTVMPAPSTTVAAGIAAMAVHDPTQSLFDDAQGMIEAAQDTTSVIVSGVEATIIRPRGMWGISTHSVEVPRRKRKRNPAPSKVSSTIAAGIAGVAELLTEGGELISVMAHSEELEEAARSAALELPVPEGVEFSFFTIPGLSVDLVVGVE